MYNKYKMIKVELRELKTSYTNGDTMKGNAYTMTLHKIIYT